MSGSDPTELKVSDPPAVKVEKVRAASHMALMVALLGEMSVLCGIVSLTVLLVMKRIPAEWTGGVIMLAIGAGAGRLLNRKDGGPPGMLGVLALIYKPIAAIAASLKHYGG